MEEQKDLLVVDDNVDSAESLAMLLEIHGYSARVVHNGHAALAAVAARVPEAVILDISMPGMDGFEVARRLRTQFTSAQLKLIGLSGYGDEGSRRQAQEAGFDQLLVKPIDVEGVIATL
ncbi:hypothetical protein WM40_00285 [Robbsia andropogonis]|uniref:Response regulatory domain-containing protein n=1 Tax=Robbsia andropogonis TaxID=28092 RepID=A0A0F5K4Z0_9BURK|nr:response regulator [Robbsia andropogonis]KKB65153.1 hypothetical protein WM40_00285 [Robbsia andropogonis]MCP1121108.1 response regulator [Robbsia andropogonis]MCP1130892.1 response regulator [Robbsia andropogonis]